MVNFFCYGFNIGECFYIHYLINHFLFVIIKRNRNRLIKFKTQINTIQKRQFIYNLVFHTKKVVFI
ncbi:MAG: hypothetical protein CL464_11065 [Acidimicrobiaceae bacterium]|nr:hypothetical protein [Acidimicrobiaceae bacterium]